jgi:hypothetical protein
MSRHRRQRNWGARIHEYAVHRLQAVVLENEVLRVGLLADKGTDLIELNFKPRDMDFAWLSANGIQDPRPLALASADPLRLFLDAYPGGWQEILPNGGSPSAYAGATYPQHGEVCMLPWDYEIVHDSAEQVTIRFMVAGYKAPFRLVKDVTLEAGRPSLAIEETLHNEASGRLPVMWGHHITFGPPFLRPGARIALPEGTHVVTHPTQIHPRHRVAPGRHEWPHVPTPTGESLDLSVIPERGQPSEIVYLTGFGEGWYEITDPDGRLGMRVEWDAAVMPYLWFWQEYGASHGYPWYGRHYNVGLEPFSSFPTDGLAEAAANGSALEVGPSETRLFHLCATVIEPHAASPTA